MMRSVCLSSLGTEWYVMDARAKDAGWEDIASASPLQPVAHGSACSAQRPAPSSRSRISDVALLPPLLLPWLCLPAAAREREPPCLRSGLARPPLLRRSPLYAEYRYRSPNGVSVIRTWQ